MSVHTGSGAQPASCPVGTEGSFTVDKAARHSRSSSAEVKNVWSYTSILPYVFMARWLIKRTGDLFTVRLCNQTPISHVFGCFCFPFRRKNIETSHSSSDLWPGLQLLLTILLRGKALKLTSRSSFTSNELFNRAPRHEGALGEWRYNSTHSWPRH